MTTILNRLRLGQDQGAELRRGGVASSDKSITIQRPISEVYSYWREVENLPGFMKHLESVMVLNEETSYWVMRSSQNHLWGSSMEFTELQEEELISWRSCTFGPILNRGSVRFSAAPDGCGTVVELSMHFWAPTAKFLAGVAQVFEQDAQLSAGESLTRLKGRLESGAVPVLADLPRRNREQLHESLLWVAHA